MARFVVTHRNEPDKYGYPYKKYFILDSETGESLDALEVVAAKLNWLDELAQEAAEKLGDCFAEKYGLGSGK